jgi:hypothetical protein
MLEKIIGGDFLQFILSFMKPIDFFGESLSNKEFFEILAQKQVPVLFNIDFRFFNFK